MAHLRITQTEAKKEFFKIYRIGNYPNIAQELKYITNVYFYNYTKQNGWLCDLLPLSSYVAITIGCRCFGEYNDSVRKYAEELDEALMNINQSNIDGMEKIEAREKATRGFIANVLEVAHE